MAAKFLVRLYRYDYCTHRGLYADLLAGIDGAAVIRTEAALASFHREDGSAQSGGEHHGSLCH
ncbi:hypothetical protein D3C73_1277760 [compost metagenome]